MKLTTREIDAVEMTESEYRGLLNNFYIDHRWTINGLTIVMLWNDDGHNMIGIEGEPFMRQVYLTDKN